MTLLTNDLHDHFDLPPEEKVGMLQNIVEGSADGVTSMEMELKLLNVALENATHQIEKLQKENQQLKEYILQMQKKEEKA